MRNLGENKMKINVNNDKTKDTLIDKSIDYKIIGVDEAGRGPIFGPVVAVAVFFDNNIFIEGVKDSKALSKLKRERLYEEIILKSKFGIGIVTPEEIDLYNIFHATEIAMNRALEVLAQYTRIENVYVDGKNLKLNYPSQCIVKGDQKIYQISAASILAKVTRDRIVEKFHASFPLYKLDRHKGYPTKQHIEALEKYGPTIYHRLTFEPILNMLSEKLLEKWLLDGEISKSRYETIMKKRFKRLKNKKENRNVEVDLFGNERKHRIKRTKI